MLALGLQRPSAGEALINGHRYAGLPLPMHRVGALLDARAVHPARTAYHHLLALARSNGLGRRRVVEVLDRVGLTAVAGKRAGTYSLGMSQRLGIATALLGDPGVLLFDEPVNGLDPSGVAWVRTLLRELAAQGRTVVVSSHLMSEMELTADRLVVIGRGRLIADTSLAEFVDRPGVLVRSDDDRVADLLRAAGATVAPAATGGLVATGIGAREIGELALAHRVVITELTPQRGSLEDVFMAMTADSVEYEGVKR